MWHVKKISFCTLESSLGSETKMNVNFINKNHQNIKNDFTKFIEILEIDYRIMKIFRKFI